MNEICYILEGIQGRRENRERMGERDEEEEVRSG